MNFALPTYIIVGRKPFQLFFDFLRNFEYIHKFMQMLPGNKVAATGKGFEGFIRLRVALASQDYLNAFGDHHPVVFKIVV